MVSPQWKISGDYFEACSCDSVCPCPTSGLAARPTQGYCDAGLVFHVERGATRRGGKSFRPRPTMHSVEAPSARR